MIRKIAIAVAFAVVVAAGYAMAGTPFGGDDTGYVPPGTPSSDIAKCEDKVANNAKNATGCIIKCHRDRAKLKLADDTAEDNCEAGDPKKSCFAKYHKTADGILKKPCPSCLNGTGQIALFNNVELLVDNTNGQVYCASPSGAFVDGAGSL
jgi:hypothetical protein